MACKRNFGSISPPNHTFCFSPPHKHFYHATTNPSKHMAGLSNISQEQFEQITVFDEKELMYYRHRSQLRKRGTPKVIILCEETGRPKVFVQKLKNSLFEVLETVGWRDKILILIDVFNILCELANEHGYFYVEKHMLRTNNKKQPVVWINHNFSANHREFAIKDSDVAEIIFVKKLKMTFSQCAVFKISPTIKTIKTILHMHEFLQGLLDADSKENMNHIQLMSRNSMNQNPFTKKKRNPPPELKNQNSSVRIDFKRNFQIIKSKSPSKFRKLPDYTPILKSPEKASFRCQKNHKNKQKDGEVANFQNSDNLQKRNGKNRKCSADVTTLSQWLKASCKKIETSFANSTFSTNTTFKYHQDYEERRDTKNNKTEKPSTQNPQSRNKMCLDQKKAYQNEAQRIQEDPLQLQMQNLFDSTSLTKKNSLKQSEINRELDKLFDREESTTSFNQNCLEDFQQLLNN